MKLYDLAGAEDDLRFSPNCWRIKMALEHKGLVAETVPWRFVEKDVIAFSGQKLVPVLVDGSTTVSDSWEIARYLESAYSDRPSLFGGPAGEGLALFVKFWCEQTLNRIVLRIILPDLFACLHDKDKAYFRESRETRFGTTLEQYAVVAEEGVSLLRSALSPMRSSLERQSYLAGAQPSFADYIVFGTLQWARSVSPVALVETGDPVFKWRERLLDAFGGFARSARHCGA
ncbi:MAG TPA: glutathione S-transferase N-terminal domain-containing protein [Candidatus Udaeobacter sp.]|jgi:glutathione S-transferase|nr:glutathione S-transferase N-terminal domain-containing protein [Candidatus Udaeobacter sp.]